MRASIFLFTAMFAFCLGCAPKIGQVTAPSTPGADRLAEHNLRFEKRVVPVGDRVWCAIGYSLGNSILIGVDGGQVIVDATESVGAAQTIKAEFDRLWPGPVLAVIYTHTHPDHFMGASVFVDDDTPVWATAKGLFNLKTRFVIMSTIVRKRAARQYGEPLAPQLRTSNGIGPFLAMDTGPVPPIILPNRTFEKRKVILIGNTTIELHAAPGETDDQLFVWLPQRKVLLPGDNFYASFPNLYSTRGVPPRPVREWIDSLDRMRELEPEYLALGHTEPVEGKEKIEELLRTYRDAIAYVHDSVIRMAGEGKSPDDIARDLKLPPHLASQPYLQEWYGKVSWSARGIYDGYLGWFNGNPTQLSRLHPEDRAKRLVPLLGGKEKIIELAREALDAGDNQWAAELADLLLAVDENDSSSKSIKAEALWTMGLAESNSNARCYLLTCAMELRGQYDGPEKPEITFATVERLPIEVILDALPVRLDPKKSADIEMRVVFDLTDTEKKFTFFIRKGVGQLSSGAAPGADVVFSGTEADVKSFLIGELSAVKAATQKRLKMSGGLDNLLKFKSAMIPQ